MNPSNDSQDGMALLNDEQRKSLQKNTPEVKVWDQDGRKESSNNQDSVMRSNASTSRTKTKKNADSFVVGNKYGMGGNESEEEDADILDQVVDKTPMTKRRIIGEENAKKVKKLGPLATSFTIFKGFVCTGLLYMPKDFINGGWLFSSACVIASLILTLYCASLLLECRAKFGGSFPDIGFAVYGKTGKRLVEISLVAS